MNSMFMAFIRNSSCNLCPRGCAVDRSFGNFGFCNSGYLPEIASICLHKGEEPVISGNSGVCNVFFRHCNLQCIYCQNYQISDNSIETAPYLTVSKAADEIERLMDQGATMLGFVSPSHQLVAMMEIISELHRRSRAPRIVYNSNGYDAVESLKALDGVVDIYLPDFKYASNHLGALLSHVPDYFSVASQAILEMYRQKGSYLSLDERGLAEGGLIIRHLVLPGFVDNSIQILNHIAEEVSLNIHLSLMAQYYPPKSIPQIPQLNRTLDAKEYQLVVDHFYKIGFGKGWIQEMGSAETYTPDFTKLNPFEL